MNVRDKRRVFLALEQLEQRWLPSTNHFVNGVLSISAPLGSLTLTQTASNTFTVVDSGAGASSPSYSGVSNILIDSGNGTHNTTINLGSGGVAFTYAGSLTINQHNGNDAVTINGTDPINVGGTGSILGNTTILTGTGNDTVALGPTNTNNLTFGGNLTLVNSSGVESVSLAGNENIVVGGNLTVTSAATIVQGGGLLNVGGTATFQDGALASGTSLLLQPGFSAKNLYVTGGQGADSVNLTAIGVNGTTAISLGQGNDTTQITGNTFNGSFSYTSGADADSVLVYGTAFNGTTRFNLGGGNDTLNLGNTPTTTSFVNGNLSITHGSGNASITVGAEITVSGNLSIQQGNGNDTIAVVNSPFGTFSLSTGNGNDSVTLGSALNWRQQWELDHQLQFRDWFQYVEPGERQRQHRRSLWLPQQPGEPTQQHAQPEQLGPAAVLSELLRGPNSKASGAASARR